MWKSLLLVALGGMSGSICRYLISLLVKSTLFPYATLIVNFVGCFFIGLLFSQFVNGKANAPDLRLLLATGFCGGFTTFSAFSLECIMLLQQQRLWAALGYIFISIFTGLAATFAGISIAK